MEPRPPIYGDTEASGACHKAEASNYQCSESKALPTNVDFNSPLDTAGYQAVMIEIKPFLGIPGPTDHNRV